MHVVHIATELTPIAKAGGLGDVLSGLCKELTLCGHRVEIILPKYDILASEGLKNIRLIEPHLPTLENGKHLFSRIFSADFENLKLILIEPDSPLKYFSRGKIYGECDDADRFTFFSTAAMEFLYRRKDFPDLIHLHDWPVALCALLHKEIYEPLDFPVKGLLLTLHNVEHQGRCSAETLSRLGLPGEDLLSQDELGDPLYTNTINLLKGGLHYSDLLVAVSPTYRTEIVHTEKGYGLEKTLQDTREKLYGILNGIDLSYWDPENDPALKVPFSTRQTSCATQIRAGKAINKKELQARLGLEISDTKPLFCTISRLALQKSPALIEQALLTTVENGGQFVLLGVAATAAIHKQFEALKKRFANSKEIAILLAQDETLAHLLYAASDAIVIPSLYEPCGLSQMIGMRYGSLPIVRRTGGLADSVSDYKNGFTFDPATKEGVEGAILRALSCYQDHPTKWNQLVCNAAGADFSWKTPAAQYQKLYAQLLQANI